MIKKTDKIVTAYAQRAAGPGWANAPIWVIVRDETGNIREECIQPKQQSTEMALLYNASEAMHCLMVRVVEQWRRKRKP